MAPHGHAVRRPGRTQASFAPQNAVTSLPIAILLACLASVAPAKKPPVEVRVQCNKVLARVGDTIRYTVTVEHDANVEAKYPDYPSFVAGFAVTEFGPLVEREVNGRRVKSRWYDLRHFLAGAYTIPGVAVQYRIPGKPKALVRSADLFVQIESVMGGDALGDIRDIQEPVAAKSRYTKYYLWAGVGAFVLIAAIVGIIVFEGRRRQAALAPPPVPAHELAYAELEQLLKLDLIGQGKVKEFYYRLSNIVRHYIENRFGLMAPERTTEEFLVEMAGTNLLAPAHKGLVSQFLERCDLVKYAKHAPGDDEIKAACDSAVQLVDETRERGETVAAPSEDGEE